MSLYYGDEYVTLHHGDCIDVMRTLPDASVDAVVTDPPYGLDFMGREWDNPGKMLISTGHEQRGAFAYGGTHSRGYADHNGTAFEQWCAGWAAEAFRVLKPGGHMLAFGGSRTWHRLAAGIEDAGFEIRDSIAWLYGSGFPKSLDVSKAIDKAERGVPQGGADPTSPNHGKYKTTRTEGKRWDGDSGQGYGAGGSAFLADGAASGSATALAASGDAASVSDAAAQWVGWGTALKPAFEPIVVARKPLIGTVAANVLEHGTGALNIDATRTEFASDADRRESTDKNQHAKFGTEPGQNNVYGDYSTTEVKDYDGSKGRWPTNVILDGSQADMLDGQTGVTQSRIGKPRSGASGEGWGMTATGAEYDDAGGASRFFPTFRYEAKAGSAERPDVNGVKHPTVKPLELMRWLCRLVTPPSGLILDPFAGSGTTLEAALLEGFTVIGIEREADYLPLIEQRITKPLQPAMFGDWS